MQRNEIFMIYGFNFRLYNHFGHQITYDTFVKKIEENNYYISLINL